MKDGKKNKIQQSQLIQAQESIKGLESEEFAVIRSKLTKEDSQKLSCYPQRVDFSLLSIEGRHRCDFHK